MRMLLLTWNMGIIDPHGICCAWYLLGLTRVGQSLRVNPHKRIP